MNGWLRLGQCEDLPTDAPPDEDKTDDKPEELEAWEHETRQVKRKLEMQPCSPRGEAVLSRTAVHIQMQAEQLVRIVSKNPTKSSKQESRAAFLSMDVTSSASQQKRFVNRPGQFVASQLSRRKVEVSVKNLSQDGLRRLEQAKLNDITQYLQNEVMEALKGNEEIRDDELLACAGM